MTERLLLWDLSPKCWDYWHAPQCPNTGSSVSDEGCFLSDPPLGAGDRDTGPRIPVNPSRSLKIFTDPLGFSMNFPCDSSFLIKREG